MPDARSSQAVEPCADCVGAAEFQPQWDLSDAARHIAYGIDGGGWCCDHVDWTWKDAAQAYQALWTVEADRRDTLRGALDRIAEHARLDERERGIAEASRYYGIAEDAVRRAKLPPSNAAAAGQERAQEAER